eukprot:jgi/Hompol1/877/HPOL_005443-RA
MFSFAAVPTNSITAMLSASERNNNGSGNGNGTTHLHPASAYGQTAHGGLSDGSDLDDDSDYIDLTSPSIDNVNFFPNGSGGPHGILKKDRRKSSTEAGGGRSAERTRSRPKSWAVDQNGSSSSLLSGDETSGDNRARRQSFIV